MTLILWAAISLLAAGQQNATERNTGMAQWRAQRDVLKGRAQHALSAEMAREKAGDCPNATTTRDQEDCLGKEMQKTGENYTEFSGGIRAILALPFPGTQDEKDFAKQRVEQFDRLEAESKKYRADASQAAYNEFKGGTLAPVFAAEAQQRLLRLHMQELAFIYDSELSNR